MNKSYCPNCKKEIDSTAVQCPYCDYRLGETIHAYLPQGITVNLPQRIVLALLIPAFFVCVLNFIITRFIIPSATSAHAIDMIVSLRLLCLIAIGIFEWYWWADRDD